MRMEYVQLGRTGLTTSRLCFGTWRFGKETDGVVETDRQQAHQLLDAAWDAGINFIDTANSYGLGNSETYIGEWLADYDREDFVIASKVLWAHYGTSIDAMGRSRGPIRRKGVSRKGIRAELAGTLDRLDTDYLDVYYVHTWHPELPLRETLRTFDDLVADGLVHTIAVSNLAGWQLMKACWESDVNGWERFELVQPRYNAIASDPSDGLLDVCADQDVAVCPYSPLAGGFLTGKYTPDGDAPAGSRGDLSGWADRFDDRDWAVLDAVVDVAEEVDATPAQVALRWLIDGEVQTVPIVGARTVEQLHENVGATELSLTTEQRDRISTAGT